MPRAPRPEGHRTQSPGPPTLRLLLVAAGEDAEAWTAAAAGVGFDVRTSGAADAAEARAALRDPLDLILAWDDEAGRRAASVVAAVEEEGAAVPVMTVAHPEAEDGVLEALAAGSAAVLERRHPGRLPAELRRFLDRESLETRLALTGRIAHELNNLLAPIPLAVQLLMRAAEPSTVRAQLEAVDAATRRTMLAVRELSEVLTAAGAVPLRVRAKHLLTLASQTWRRSPGGPTTVLTEYPPDLRSVRVDVVRLLQVLWCLARRALDQGGGRGAGGGELLFTGRNVGRSSPEGGAAVELRVVHAPPGEGVGPLGVHPVRTPEPSDRLEAVVEVVAAGGGAVGVVEARSGRAGYALVLPAVGDRAGAGAGGARPDRSRPGPEKHPPATRRGRVRAPGGSARTALVIEGDEEVRRMTRETLEGSGWRVLTAADGTEGVAVYAENLGSVGTVLVGMSLTYMDGLTTIKALRRIGDGARMILTAGGAWDPRRLEGEEGGPDAVLRKPYDAESLLRALGG